MTEASLYLIILAVFATVVLLAYGLTPKRFRYIVLFTASIAAYFFLSRFLGVFILVTAFSVYLCGYFVGRLDRKYAPGLKALPREERREARKKLQRKKNLILLAVLVLNVGILLALKYLNFFAGLGADLVNLFGGSAAAPAFKILLPLGISYYTLQALGYAIDVVCGKYEPERNPVKAMLFVCFFPQLLEGPIGRYDEMRGDLSEGNPVKAENVYRGLLRVAWGLFKILIVSNRFGMLAGEVFGDYAKFSGFTILFGVFAFTVQLYAEFSGYIDAAAGVGEMFGIRLKKNFDLPFLSKDVGEFWRRWHISLGGWFRDYVFFPITASGFALKLRTREGRAARVGSALVVGAGMLSVWFLTGLWHGASVKYILYGLYYFVLMVSHELLKPLFSRLYKALRVKEEGVAVGAIRVVKTCALVGIGMLLFRAENPAVFGKMLASVFTCGGENFAVLTGVDLKDFIVAFVGLGIMAGSGVARACGVDLIDRIVRLPLWAKFALTALFILVIVVFGAYGMGYMPPDPIYGEF